MTMREFDKELSQLEADVRAVHADHSPFGTASKTDLVGLKVKIIKSQMAIDRDLDRILSVASQDLLLLPQAHTLVHWAGVMRDRFKTYLTLQSKTLSRRLWLKLIRSRLGDLSDSQSLTFDPDDLVDLALRRSTLVKSEKILTNSLISLSAERKKLGNQYIETAVARANIEAAGSLQARLGVTLSHALRNPTVKALGTLLSQSSMPKTKTSVDWNPFREKSYDALKHCRDILTNMLSGRAPGERSLRRFAETMNQLEELEAETKEDANRIQAGPFAGLSLRSRLDKDLPAEKSH